MKEPSKITAYFATDLSVPNRYRREGDDELELLGLHRRGSQLQNGYFGFDTRHPTEVAVELDSVTDALRRVVGEPALEHGFNGDVLQPLSVLEILEVVSGSPIRRFELKKVLDGSRRLEDEATQAANESFQNWFRLYFIREGLSPTGHPLLDARASAASKLHSQGGKTVSADQFRALVGKRVFETLKKSKTDHFLKRFYFAKLGAYAQCDLARGSAPGFS